MKPRLTVGLLFLCAAMSAPVFAATPAQEMRAQCATDAGSRAGEERKTFVRDCVKAKRAANKKPASDKQLAVRAKMKLCSADFKASGKAKEARREFMSGCLKG